MTREEKQLQEAFFKELSQLENRWKTISIADKKCYEELKTKTSRKISDLQVAFRITKFALLIPLVSAAILIIAVYDCKKERAIILQEMDASNQLYEDKNRKYNTVYDAFVKENQLLQKQNDSLLKLINEQSWEN